MRDLPVFRADRGNLGRFKCLLCDSCVKCGNHTAGRGCADLPIGLLHGDVVGRSSLRECGLGVTDSGRGERRIEACVGEKGREGPFMVAVCMMEGRFLRVYKCAAGSARWCDDEFTSELSESGAKNTTL